MKKTDIDIDVPDRKIVDTLNLPHYKASMIHNDVIKEHNCGIYFQKVPTLFDTNISTIPYDKAPEYGYFKVDVLTNSVYENIKDEEDMNNLLHTEPDWSLLDYRENVEKEFEKNPSADMILFNVDVTEDRKTYQIDSPGRVRLFNSGRYPTYSMAVKLDRVRSKNICFSLLFGGGAKYSNGEDSLFISDCIRRGLKVYKVPVKIGKEVSEKSSWFTGYNEKFFFDRGVLYHYLYGYLAKPIALRFLYKHKSTLCEVFSLKEAYKTMKKGILEAKKS